MTVKEVMSQAANWNRINKISQKLSSGTLTTAGYK